MADSLPPKTLAWLHQSAAVDGAAYSQVLLHLLERVEALEQPPAAQPAPPPAPAGRLVERVAHFIGDPDSPAELWHDDARAAIREVAAAARGRIAPFDPSLKWGDFAQWLEQEADR